MQHPEIWTSRQAPTLEANLADLTLNLALGVGTVRDGESRLATMTVWRRINANLRLAVR
jgi:hypothetical protein